MTPQSKVILNNQKLKLKILLILLSVLASFIVIERQILITGVSLIYANLTRDMSHFVWDTAWVMRYNEAIWLSGSGRYSEAKTLLAPLLNDTTITRRAEIAELYGDLIYSTSGSLDDTIRMYDRSLWFSPSDRVSEKIAYIKLIQSQKTGSGTTEPSPKTDSGSQVLEAKKTELQKTAWERDKYLWNSISSQAGLRSDLQRLIESSQSNSVTVTQDW